ncbi:MAG: 50S ribosomal protein L25/general stress protein Ctc [Peptococcaceae bacterium]|nr:50S ribosomal protein L25/general stress protein Ctc [Peptococcaceae bacterium]
MASASMKVEQRDDRGRSARNRLKVEGKIPAVVYGRKIGSVAIAVEGRVLESILSNFGGKALIEMEIPRNGETAKYHTIIKELQRHPYKQEILHVDFQQISLEEELETTTALHLVGDAAGAEKGGVVEQLLWEVEISCLPTNIPEYLEVDISSLDVGETLHVAQINPPEGVKILTDPDTVVASCYLEKAETEAEEEAGEEETAGGEARETAAEAGETE